MANVWLEILPPKGNQIRAEEIVNPRPKNMPERDSPPVVYFLIMFTMNMLRRIVNETNRYATQFIRSEARALDQKRFWSVHAWKSVTLPEMKGFIAQGLKSKLLTRLKPKEGHDVVVATLYDRFRFEWVEGGYQGKVPTVNLFVDYLKSLYPMAEKVRRRIDGKNQTVYTGLDLKPLTDGNEQIDFQAITDLKPESFRLKDGHNNSAVTFECDSDFKTNGSTIVKQLSFNNNGTISLSVASKDILLAPLGIDNKYELTKRSIQAVFFIVSKLKICHGVKMNKSVVVSRFHTLETITVNEDSFRCLKSVSCNVIINSQANTCRTCQKMTFTGEVSSKDRKCTENSDASQTTRESINIHDSICKLFPNAPEPMVKLLCEQSKNVSKHPNGRRYSKDFMCTCLQLFNRSPKCYEMLIQTKLLILPSKPVLLQYKNALKQEPGFDDSVFLWMHEEANRRGMTDSDRLGGIIFDEMCIQQDIQIEKNGDVLELTGLTDLGQEGNLCNKLRKGDCTKTIGTHILQLLFLGLNGFRFPFAYFVTDNIQASEIYGLFWKAVCLLFEFGFKVLYTCMDGAQANRSFMHGVIDQRTFIAESPCTNTPIVFMMDISHVLKKIRNNISKSGNSNKDTRLLTLPSTFSIHWQMFIDFFLWDQQNALQLNRKLSKEHMSRVKRKPTLEILTSI